MRPNLARLCFPWLYLALLYLPWLYLAWLFFRDPTYHDPTHHVPAYHSRAMRCLCSWCYPSVRARATSAAHACCSPPRPRPRAGRASGQGSSRPLRSWWVSVWARPAACSFRRPLPHPADFYGFYGTYTSFIYCCHHGPRVCSIREFIRIAQPQREREREREIRQSQRARTVVSAPR